MKSTRYGSLLALAGLAGISVGVAETMLGWGACFRVSLAVAPGTLAGSDITAVKAIVAGALVAIVALTFVLSLFSETRRRVIVPAASFSLAVLVAFALKHAPVDVVSSVGAGTRRVAGSTLTVWELVASLGCGALLAGALFLVGGGRRLPALARRRWFTAAPVRSWNS
jgi:hypothetical protein